MTNQQLETKKAFVNLSSLRKNLPEYGRIEEKYVTIFHTELDRLINLGSSDLVDFKIPSNEIMPNIESYDPFGEAEKLSSEKYVDRNIFLMKLDAVLSYFSLSSPEVEIGFNAN